MKDAELIRYIETLIISEENVQKAYRAFADELNLTYGHELSVRRLTKKQKQQAAMKAVLKAGLS